MNAPHQPLAGQVAVVAGATRGAGRGIAVLGDVHVADKSGGLLSSWALAKEYGFTDLDGRRPDWGTFFARKVHEIVHRHLPPDEMDVFVVRTRLQQAELDPSAAPEAAHLRAWLEQSSNQGV